jgi:soluble cytochrome b562
MEARNRHRLGQFGRQSPRPAKRGERPMATDVEIVLAKLSKLRAALPKSGKPLPEGDYAKFTKQVDNLIADLRKAVEPTKQMEKDLSDYDKQKKTIEPLVDKINKALRTRYEQSVKYRSYQTDIKNVCGKLVKAASASKDGQAKALINNIKTIADATNDVDNIKNKPSILL